MVDTVLHTKSVVAEILTEGAIGGGDGGGAYVETALTEANTVPMQSPPEGSGINMPLKETNKMFIPEIGSDVGAVKVFDNGIIVADRTFDQLIQDDRWINAIVTSMRAGGGALPTPTFGIHWEVGAQKQDNFGVYPIKWVLSLVPKTFPIQHTTIRYVNGKLGAAAAYTPGAQVFSNAKPLVNNDFAITVSTIGDLKWKKVTVTLELITVEDPEVTEERHKYPYIEDIKIEVDLTVVFYSAQMLEVQALVAAMTDINIVIALGSGIITKDTLTINNLFIKPESISLNEIPIKGLFEFKMKLIPGDQFAVASDLTLA